MDLASVLRWIEDDGDMSQIHSTLRMTFPFNFIKVEAEQDVGRFYLTDDDWCVFIIN